MAATARQGDSGGPILDAEGKLAGVLFGQNEGRTIGSCSTRLRTFLASVGSRGFTPTPIAEFSDTPALARGISAMPVQFERAETSTPGDAVTRLGAMPGEDALPRSMHLPATDVSGLPAAFSHPPIPAAMADLQVGSLADVFDIYHNGRQLLAAAGGLALALLGVRTILASRS